MSRSNLTTHLENIILKEMPENVISIELELIDEILPANKPKFHYTHGLKDHYGNCQRLFHGHSNTVDVLVNDQRMPEFEEMFANDLFKGNIHFCFWDNVQNKEEIISAHGDIPLGSVENCPNVQIAYESSQGFLKV